MITRRHALTLLSAIPFAGIGAAAYAKTPMVFSNRGAAINGYDPVAYFTEGKPVMGRPGNSLVWKRAAWRFASAGNMAAFEANPRAYAPQYGGYCAYSMSLGQTATTEPDAWRIYEGKLYLIHNRRVRSIWAQDVAGNILRADAQWPAVLRR